MPTLLPRLAAIAGLILLAACTRPDDTPDATPSLTVSVATPQRDSVVHDVVASGAVAAWEEVSVGVELSGLRVAAVEVEVGSVVKQGDVLLRLDTRTQDARLAEAEAAVAEARANLTVAERKARRVGELAAQRPTRRAPAPARGWTRPPPAAIRRGCSATSPWSARRWPGWCRRAACSRARWCRPAASCCA